MAADAEPGHDGVMAHDTAVPPGGTPTDNRFFGWMRSLGVVRRPGWLGGVSAGIAERLGIDALIVRGIIVVIAIFGGPALLLYAAAWALLPDSSGRIHFEEMLRGHVDKALAGIGVMVLLAMLPFAQGFWGFGWFAGDFDFGSRGLGIFWTLCLIAVAIWFVVWIAKKPSASQAVSDAYTAATTWPSEATTASAADATATTTAPLGAPLAPPAPPAGADDEQLSAWKEQQSNWKAEYEDWKRQQAATAQELARQRTAEQRQVRQAEQAERQREYAERKQLTRSNPVYSLVAIGLSLVAGASVALFGIDAKWELPTTLITAFGTSLGVLGLAIVINGFRGKRSGGASGVAVLVVLALLTSSFYGWARGPLLSDSQILWQPVWSEEGNRVVVSGAVTLDLEDYFDDSNEGFSAGVNLLVVDGAATVILPADAHSTIEADVTSGTITIEGTTNELRGSLLSSSAEFAPRAHELDADEETNRLYVEVRVISGTITVTQAR